MIKSLKFTFYITLCISCIGSAYEKKLNNGYFLSATDVREDMYLGGSSHGYDIGIIDATVYAVGQNDDFIVVKQHPRIFPDTPDKSITNFFIIPLKNKVSSKVETNLIGPLTAEGFENKKQELKIPNIEFAILFDLK